jgi:mono/diheme cytochrome c family protein
MKVASYIAVVTVLVGAGAGSAAAQTSSGTASTPKDTSAKDTSSAKATSSTGAATGTPLSPELIAQGDKIFHGPGNCYACHGTNAQGLVGPNLTDAEWIHSKGTYEDIVAQVIKGVPKEESKSGIVMPPRGGSTISDDEVKAVAAYVYSLSHK